MAKRRKKAVYKKARRGSITKQMKARRSHYMKNRRKILRAAKTHYRKNRAKIRKQQAKYRKIIGKKRPRRTYAAMGRAGGRFHRFKRLPRVNKYTRVGGARKRRKA